MQEVLDPDSAVAVDHRTPVLEADRQRGDEEDRRDDDADQAPYDQVERPLGEEGRTTQNRRAKIEER